MPEPALWERAQKAALSGKETKVMLTIAAVTVSWFAVAVLLHIAIDDYRRHTD